MRSLKIGAFLLTTSLIPSMAFAAYGDNPTVANSHTVLTKEITCPVDTLIEARLQTAYLLNLELKRFNIKVSVNNAAVTLDGAVQNQAQKELAEAIARDLEGVDDVVNNIVVDKNTQAGEKRGDFGQKVIDATITAMIKSKLLAHPHTSALTVTVATVNNVVTLTGKVGSVAEKEAAGRLAVQTTGVSAVKNKLKVVKQ